jgi:hypothetical protein
VVCERHVRHVCELTRRSARYICAAALADRRTHVHTQDLRPHAKRLTQGVCARVQASCKRVEGRLMHAEAKC